jgi:hypothetical protein
MREKYPMMLDYPVKSIHIKLKRLSGIKNIAIKMVDGHKRNIIGSFKH